MLSVLEHTEALPVSLGTGFSTASWLNTYTEFIRPLGDINNLRSEDETSDGYL